MTVLEEARLEQQRNPQLRLGQAVYNVAYRRNPAVAQLAGTEFDPFHDDSRIDAFLKKIGEIPADEVQ
jgi:hypothetical protein